MRSNRCLWTGILVLGAACGDPDKQPLFPRAVGPRYRLDVRTELTQVWSGDTIRFSAMLAPRLGDTTRRLAPPPPVLWSVADTTMARLLDNSGPSIRVIAKRTGTVIVNARADSLQGTAVFGAISEGDLLDSIPLRSSTWMSGPAVGDDGTIYVMRSLLSNGGNDSLAAFAPDLSLKWQSPLGYTNVNGTPTILRNGTIVVGASSRLFAFGPTGIQLWKDTLGGDIESTPALDGQDNIYSGRQAAGRVSKYTSGGALVWSDTGASLKVAGLVVGDSVVLWGSFVGKRLIGRSLRTGEVLWVDTLAGTPRYFAPSAGADGRTIYVPARLYVYAVDGLDGTVRWTYPVGGELFPQTPVVDADGTIYVQINTSLLALNPDGSVRWVNDSIHSFAYGNQGGAPALAAGGVIYTGCMWSDGTPALCAARTSDGALLWRQSLPVPGFAGPITILRDSSIVLQTLDVNDASYLLRFRGRHALANAPWPMDGRDYRRTRHATPWP